MKKVKKNLLLTNTTTLNNLSREKKAKNKDELMYNSGFEYYDSKIESYEKDFEEVLYPHESFNEFLKKEYADKIGKLIGIELGGPGVNFFKDIEWDIFKKTAGFTLKKLPDYVEVSNHEVLEADVFSRTRTRLSRHYHNKLQGEDRVEFSDDKSWNQVLDWVKENGKPDFIIERMVGPLFAIRSARLFMLILDRWYRILNDEGSMFIEVPRDFKVGISGTERIDYGIVKRYLENIKLKNKNIILEFSDMSDLSRFREGRLVIFIKKLKDSPRSLSNLK